MKGFLLDTNVVSEPMRARPLERVLQWMDAIPPNRAYISILTLAEMDKGIELLDPTDSRRTRLLAYRASLEAAFAGRILSLDDETVRSWGVLVGRYRRRFGGEAPAVDAMLAATAQRRRLYLATRNIKDVHALGCTVFNPWTDDPAAFPLQA